MKSYPAVSRLTVALAIVFGIVVASAPPGSVAARAPEPSVLPEAPSAVPARAGISVRQLQLGISGTIEADLLSADLTGDGEAEVLVGTSRGLYVLSGGTLLYHIPTSSPVIDAELLSDVTGDGRPDFALATGDTYFPNIRAYDGVSGEKAWHFVPKQEVFIENLMWTEQQTRTFDIEAVDLNRDGITDVAATSGYRVHAVDGRTGAPLWYFEAVDNMWKVAAIDDVNGDQVPDVAAGGQNGMIYVIDGSEGSLIWQKRLVDKYNTIDERGNVASTVERSIWDIVPVDAGPTPSAVVSSEDGKVRLVGLEDGAVAWEATIVQYVDAMLLSYYRESNGHATSPGAFHFFNVRASQVPDVTGDGVGEILATAYLGSPASGRQQPRGAGLFLVDAVSGTKLWENTAVSLQNIARLEVASPSGQPVILLPSSSIQTVSLASGTLTETVALPGESGDSSSQRYMIKDLGDGEFLLTTSEGDLYALEYESSNVLWNYPRVAEAAVETGEFTGDGTADILVRSVTYPQGRGGGDAETRARVLYVVDGATRETAWSYEVPFDELATTGGIAGVRVAPDLDGDGKQDIIGFVQPPNSDREQGNGEDSEIIALSGMDGSVLLRQKVVEGTYYGVWETLFEDPSVLENMIRDDFEARMNEEIPRERERWVNEYRDQFERNIEDQWRNEEENRYREFEEQLAQEMQDGLSEEDAGQRREDFRRELPAQREGFLQQTRDDLEEQLSGELARWTDQTVEEWRQGFEQNELPEQMAQWRDRLENEREGRRISKQVISFDVLRTPLAPGGVALLAGCQRDIFVLDPTGDLLWTWTYEPWTYQDPFTGEVPTDMIFGLSAGGGTVIRVLGDVNADGTDDLVAFSGQEITVALSAQRAGRLVFEPGPTILLENGMDSRQGQLIDDVDGDGVKDILYPRHRENEPPVGILISSSTGEELFRLDDMDSGSMTVDLAAADFDGDGIPDSIVFHKWMQDREGPILRVMSGRTGRPIWDFNDYKETFFFDQWQYQGSITPATPIKDVTGDGIPDLALAKSLTWQAGAVVIVYDVANDRLVKEIVIEKIDDSEAEHQEQRWHPALLVSEVGDLDGDGQPELAVTAVFGESEREKRLQMVVVDVAREQVVADFQTVGSKFIDLGTGEQFGLVGLAGEVYFLDAFNDLKIVSPFGDSAMTSPVTIRWTGVEPGAFNQVFIDNVEVARTNENEVTVPAARGEH
ncbi:MAG: PQQ-binding-like beta-propeller repeat protein, partial [Chloroflexi bacterium]|nr:PQQ-binding-like beta-propeller repeat protein [Chloroflexota bacterium]